MKILLVAKYFYPIKGGIETVVYETAKCLKNLGNEVTVVTVGKKSKETINGINIIRTPALFSISGEPAAIGFFKEIMKLDFDICHLQAPNPFQNIMAVAACILKKKPWIVAYQSDIIRFSPIMKAVNWVYKNTIQRPIILKMAKKVLASSPPYLKGSSTLKGLKNTGVLQNSIKIRSVEKKEKQENNILFVGRIIYYKGIGYLVKSMKEVVEQVPSAKLTIVGNGNLRREMEKLSKDLKLENNIIFAGEVSEEELQDHYKNTDIFVFPSIYKSEAFGMVQLEAMMNEKPIISTKIKDSGVSWVNKDGVSGITINPMDHKELSDAIIKLLKDKKLRIKYGKGGRKRLEDEFDIKKLTKKLLEIYKECI
jgi:glycosyltransferase involved in cell wall biosynthesis